MLSFCEHAHSNALATHNIALQPCKHCWQMPIEVARFALLSHLFSLFSVFCAGMSCRMPCLLSSHPCSSWRFRPEPEPERVEEKSVDAHDKFEIRFCTHTQYYAVHFPSRVTAYPGFTRRCLSYFYCLFLSFVFPQRMYIVHVLPFVLYWAVDLHRAFLARSHQGPQNTLQIVKGSTSPGTYKSRNSSRNWPKKESIFYVVLCFQSGDTPRQCLLGVLFYTARFLSTRLFSFA